MPILMPQVFDKVDMYGNQLSWDFSKYQPDKLFICLGQNDGIQDSSTFVQAYIGFLDSLNKVYPSSEVLLLSSPMADEKLREWFRRVLPSVVNEIKDRFKNIRYHIFEKQYIGGCDFHPSVEEHEAIAKELLET
jgi:lysophospholipase L1-like esterase